MELQRTRLRRTIAIDNIITMYYFEFTKDYVFRGEKHDFWEFLYVDKGEVEVMADTTVHRLKQGSIIFHKPNEFHSFFSYHGTAPNLIVMTFDCHSRAMKHLERQVIPLQDEERNLLAQIIKEGMNVFPFPFRYPLVRKEQVPVGSEQMIRILLETFLIRLVRNIVQPVEAAVPLSSLAKEKNEDDVARAIIRLLEERLDANPSLEEIGEAMHLSKTRLKQIFKRKTGQGIMEYFAGMKIDRAKTFIREGTLNFTEIAGRLGFSSVHYFSKAFKRATGMNPTEYAKSVKARS